ncbi:energy-coupling factor transporter transmembrane component T [Bacillus carboniphilus]|uniref:Energy-coupling factor transporter transmembrane protein EcfT n=1 Tax=Bacillus carboniphilus TaxID=86663 RepID=A0ABY9JRJ6_9BACI|nr:energy-coupling factor transporter transmembrane component T [Bacillus carboniphilus]WLR42011.1 energy-coupling factor transporter transmembrane component T [Bacillus carboniphilus]
MNSFIIGKYVPGQSLIHRLDPRSKLAMVFLFVFIVFIANNTLTYSFLIFFVATIVMLTKIPVSFIWNGMKPVIWLVIFTFVLHIFFTKGGPVLVDLAFVQVYEEGLRQAIFISCRFVLLIMITTVLTLTTTPIEITDGIEMGLHPLKKVKLPIHELALMMSISLRFIPTLMEETDKIIKAQKARGADFTSGPIKERVKALIPLLVPLFISAFKRADDLATAMESRGYRGSEGRTKLRQLRWKTNDTLLILSLAGLSIILFIFRT